MKGSATQNMCQVLTVGYRPSRTGPAHRFVLVLVCVTTHL